MRILNRPQKHIVVGRVIDRKQIGETTFVSPYIPPQNQMSTLFEQREKIKRVTILKVNLEVLGIHYIIDSNNVYC